MAGKEIPQRIFIYWAEGFSDAPRLVKASVESWRRHNPDFDIVLLDDRNLEEYVTLSDYIRSDSLAALPIQKRANLIRKALLVRHGGIWADATLYCSQPLENWLDFRPKAGFVAVRGDRGANRFIQNYFLASVRGGQFMRAWLDSYSRYFSRGLHPMTRPTQKRWSKRYPVLLATKLGTLVWTIPQVARRTGYPYLIAHYLANRLIMLNPSLAKRYSELQHVSVGRALSYETVPGGLDQMAMLWRKGAYPLWKLTWREHLTPDFWEGVYQLTGHTTHRAGSA